MMNNLLTGKELEEALGMSRSTIYRLRKEGMPHIKVSEKNVKYDLAEVKKWLDNKGGNDEMSAMMEEVEETVEISEVLKAEEERLISVASTRALTGNEIKRFKSIRKEREKRLVEMQWKLTQKHEEHIKMLFDHLEKWKQAFEQQETILKFTHKDAQEMERFIKDKGLQLECDAYNGWIIGEVHCEEGKVKFIYDKPDGSEGSITFDPEEIFELYLTLDDGSKEYIEFEAMQLDESFNGEKARISSHLLSEYTDRTI